MNFQKVDFLASKARLGHKDPERPARISQEDFMKTYQDIYKVLEQAGLDHPP
jgi:hypothetical protein